MKARSRNVARLGFAYLMIIVVLGVVISVVSQMPESEWERWTLTDVAEAAQEGEIERIVVISDTQMRVTLTDGRVVSASKDPSGTGMEQLETLGVTAGQLAQIKWEGSDTSSATIWSGVITLVFYLIPMIILVGVIVWLVHRKDKVSAE